MTDEELPRDRYLFIKEREVYTCRDADRLKELKSFITIDHPERSTEWYQEANAQYRKELHVQGLNEPEWKAYEKGNFCLLIRGRSNEHNHSNQAPIHGEEGSSRQP